MSRSNRKSSQVRSGLVCAVVVGTGVGVIVGSAIDKGVAGAGVTSAVGAGVTVTFGASVTLIMPILYEAGVPGLLVAVAVAVGVADGDGLGLGDGEGVFADILRLHCSASEPLCIVIDPDAEL
jgi:hypothetical protein